ncbi:hypothetical protein LZ30DRAFT_466136 [Colletotrichum cereale]|nr:hypothetical protein LZ30DRAFT_466136 [Colletotrichum cereale]
MVARRSLQNHYRSTATRWIARHASCTLMHRAQQHNQHRTRNKGNIDEKNRLGQSPAFAISPRTPAEYPSWHVCLPTPRHLGTDYPYPSLASYADPFTGVSLLSGARLTFHVEARSEACPRGLEGPSRPHLIHVKNRMPSSLSLSLSLMRTRFGSRGQTDGRLDATLFLVRLLATSAFEKTSYTPPTHYNRYRAGRARTTTRQDVRVKKTCPRPADSFFTLQLGPHPLGIPPSAHSTAGIRAPTSQGNSGRDAVVAPAPAPHPPTTGTSVVRRP